MPGVTPPPKRPAKPSKKPAIQLRIERLYVMVSELQQRMKVLELEVLMMSGGKRR